MFLLSFFAVSLLAILSVPSIAQEVARSDLRDPPSSNATSAVVNRTTTISSASQLETIPCIFSYSGSVPVDTSGTAIMLPVTSGGPLQTVPCWEILAYAYQHMQSSSTTPSSTKNDLPFLYTYAATVPSGATEVVDFPEAYGSVLYATLTGPTTYYATVTVAESQTDYFTEEPPSIITETITVTGSEEAFQVPMPHDTYATVTLTGPATYTTTQIYNFGDNWKEIGDQKYTWTVTVDVGSELLRVASGTTYFPTTIVGPTTWTVTVTEAWPGDLLPVRAGFNTSDPHCNGTLTGTQSSHYATYQTLLAMVTDHETVTTQVTTGGFYGKAQSSFNLTLTGPTTIYATNTEIIDALFFGPDAGFAGNVCGGMCAECQLYYPEVFVYYWPVPSPETGCLTAAGNSSTPTIQRDSSAAIRARPRALSKREAGASTVVNTNGFTFTSPSVYIAFPTISAADNCGNLGDVHTSVTLGFPPTEISTGVFVAPYGSISYSPFDFRYAQCPPPSLSGPHFGTLIGPAGYNPLIAPPAGLTLIDPKWNANCFAAPFQGRDPPTALTPQANLVVDATSTGPVADPTAASPSAALPPVASKTSMYSPSTATALVPGSQSGSSSGADSPGSGSPDPNGEDTGHPSGQGSSDPSSQGSSGSSEQGSGDPSGHDPSDSPGEDSDDPSGQDSSDSTGHGTSGSSGHNSANEPNNPPQHTAAPAVLSFAGQAITANAASAFVIDSQTLVPGGQITVSNTPISLATDGFHVVVGQVSTAALSPDPAHTNLITLGNQVYTAIYTGSKVTIAGTTLSPDAVITIAGIPISLDPASDPTAAPSLIIGPATTFSLVSPHPATTSAATTSDVKFLTIAGSVYTANTASDFVIDSQTLMPGGPGITVAGTLVSIPSVPSPTGASGASGSGDTVPGGIGGVIMSGIGGVGAGGVAGNGGGASASPSVLVFEGGVGGARKWSWWWLGWCGMVAIILGYL